MKEMVKDYTPEKVAEICQIDADMLREAARIYAKADRAPIMYCLGVTEHHTGTEGVMSLSNMAMMVGKLGKPGCGVNPIRGQNNVQGACGEFAAKWMTASIFSDENTWSQNSLLRMSP